MEIIIAQRAGACYGVGRALDMVLKASEELSCVHTLGPLIHNPYVVADLESRGIGVVDNVDQPKGSAIVIRSHGVVPEIIDEARARGLEVIDATCPYVKKVHMAAEKFSRENYQVIIVGEAGHPEVEGIKGHAKDALIIGSVEAASNLDFYQKIGVVVQTTQSSALLKDILCVLVDKCSELRVKNTICSATTERQAAALELACKVDSMIVIGGKMSGNTTRLYEICSQRCSNTHHIESADELDPLWFSQVDTVGITAGASTPESHIQQVVEAIKQI